jgi:transcription-repair coupling factor (superfamily II helicase)
VDYVYEPGQYTVRGSLIDVYSFSNEYPYRIDFFGDEIDSIRTFEVDNQLTKEQLQKITIVPQIRQSADGKGVSFLECIPKEAILAAPNFEQIKEALQYLFEDTVSHQARIVQEEV